MRHVNGAVRKPYRVSFVGAYDLSAVDVAPNPADIDYGVLPLTGYIAPREGYACTSAAHATTAV
ncbi:hypothetical protein HMPREF3192_00080 [Atopobium deltae]|uniref:Uncharacterized protein n=1 Tax=Atopobium deltae TaxID=1393034 RepID=A0A133XXJ6_9ACTN|nr:hypothetical protein HMPREF3192_00080 [Atopobium deltae]